MATTVIFPRSSERSSRLHEDQRSAEIKHLRDELAKVEDLVSRIVKSLKSGSMVKIVDADGEEVMAREVPSISPREEPSF